MASLFCASDEKFPFVGQLIFATVAIQAALNSRETSGKSTRKGTSITGFFSSTTGFSIGAAFSSTGSVISGVSAFTIPLSSVTTSTAGDFNSFGPLLFLREAQEYKTVDKTNVIMAIFFIDLHFISYKTNVFMYM